MHFSDLVAYAKERNVSKRDLLVILPSFRSFDNVSTHLDYLSRQKFQEFNVILVLGRNLTMLSLRNS